MAYEYEADEWRRATQCMTEVERAQAADSGRAAIGLCGDRSDALDDMGRW